MHWLLFRYRAKIIAVNEIEGTVRYKLLECIDDSGSGRNCPHCFEATQRCICVNSTRFLLLLLWPDSDEQYDSEEDPLDAGFLDRIEPV